MVNKKLKLVACEKNSAANIRVSEQAKTSVYKTTKTPLLLNVQ